MKITIKTVLMSLGLAAIGYIIIGLFAYNATAQELTTGVGTRVNDGAVYGSYDYEGAFGGFGFSGFKEGNAAARVMFGFETRFTDLDWTTQFEIGDDAYTPNFSTEFDGTIGGVVALHPTYSYMSVSAADSANEFVWTPGIGLSIGNYAIRLTGRASRTFVEDNSIDSFSGELSLFNALSVSGGTGVSELALFDIGHNTYFVSGSVRIPFTRRTGVLLRGSYVEDCVSGQNYYTTFVGLNFR